MINQTKSDVGLMDLHKQPSLAQWGLTFSLTGDVCQSDFVPWMEKQACKFGVGFTVVERAGNELMLRAVGAPEMTQAFALSCSLGPESVLVDQLRIIEAGEVL